MNLNDIKKAAIDKIGQEVNLGDWAAVTQHNAIYVGKVVKCGEKSVTIALNKMQEYIIKGGLTGLHWKDIQIHLSKEFGSDYIKKYGYHGHNPDWVRDGKFVKITSTGQMELEYENGKTT